MNVSTIVKPVQTIKLYGTPVSGHCHRIELFLSLLELPYELINVDLASKAHKAPEFLKMNPFGQVPVIQDGDLTLADSNAILVYLAHKYAPNQWLPDDPIRSAQVQGWLSVAAGLLAFGPAAARAMTLFGRTFNPEEVTGRAHALFAVMNQVLLETPFLVGFQPTLADIANYSYTVRAPEGKISLKPYSHILAWLARVEGLPRFIPMMNVVADHAAP